MSRPPIGILSLAPPEAELRSGVDKTILLYECDLAEALREKGYHVIPGGAPYAEEDRIATSAEMARRHAHTLMDFGPSAVVVNVTAGPRTAELLEAVRYLERELKAPLRLIIYADESRFGARAAALAAAGSLREYGFPFSLVVGSPRDVAVIDRIAAIAIFHTRAFLAQGAVHAVVQRLKRRRFVSYGPLFDRSSADSFDPELWYERYGIGFDARSFVEIEERAFRLLYGDDGDEILDQRIRAALATLRPTLTENRPSLERTLARHLAIYFAIEDDVRESEGTFAAMHLPRRAISPEPSAWIVAAWLSSDHGPAGLPKDITPAVPTAEPHSALAALVLREIAALPVGYVEIRDVVDRRIELSIPAMSRHFFVETPRLDPEAGRILGPWKTNCPTTMLTFARVGRREKCFCIETTSAVTRRDDLTIVELAMPLAAAEFSNFWPRASGVVGGGHFAAEVFEWAQRSGLDFRIVDSRGECFERSR